MTEVLGPKQGYVDMLDSATVARAAEQLADNKYNPLRPSSAGKCTRELAYELMQFHGRGQFSDEKRTAETQRIFGLGHHVENHILQEFRDNVPTCQQKYKQQVLSFFRVTAKDPALNHLVEGSLDACMWSPGSKGVIDAKSKKDRFSAFHKSAWDDTDEKLSSLASVQRQSAAFYWVPDLAAFLKELKDPFFEANFMQLNGYACTEFLRERGVDHGSIIQYNKNDSRMREVRFRPSLELFEAIRLKFQAATDAADANDPTQAPRDYMLGNIKCAYCPFKRQCWPGTDATKQFYATFPKKEWPKDTAYMGESGAEIEALMATYKGGTEAAQQQQDAESKVLAIMMKRNLEKIRLEDGSVYVAKQLKDGIVLRRGKA